MNNKWVGIGLRAQHYQEILDNLPAIAWFEVHSENYFGEGGKPISYLKKIHQHYPVSFHGIGLSLGSADEINYTHLHRLKKLITDFSPLFISEHLSWSSIDGRYLHDLLPLPLTDESFDLMVKKIIQVQDYLNHPILLENISSYLEFTHSTIPETEFLSALAKTTGCGILLDINNLYVNSVNHQYNAEKYLQQIPANLIKEIHLAGHTQNSYETGTILIDTHNQLIVKEVWDLYAKSCQLYGTKPTLIEWDKDIPELNVLLQEATKAQEIMEMTHVIV